MFYVEVKWLLVVLKVLSNQVLHAYVWFSFFLRSQQWRVFSWLRWWERGLQPWRSCRAGHRISELKLNGNLRWGNINHFIQLSSWRTCGVWTKRTTRLQWNVAEPALIWPYLVLGLLGKQILIWAVSRNVEGMSSLWRKSGGSLVWLLVWPEYWTRSCLTESIWAAGGIFLLHWWMISVWISTLFGFSWTELIQMSVHTHRWQMTWDALCTTHRLFSFISLKEDFTY